MNQEEKILAILYEKINGNDWFEQKYEPAAKAIKEYYHTEIIEPLKKELADEKEQHQISMNAMTNAIDTNEELTTRIQKLEKEKEQHENAKNIAFQIIKVYEQASETRKKTEKEFMNSLENFLKTIEKYHVLPNSGERI